MVRNNRGVTLTSLSVYIVVSIVILASLSFLNINVMSQIADLSQESEKSNEVLKVQASLITDIKSANRVLSFSENELVLDNGVRYYIKYRANKKEGEQTYNVYELYRDDVLITDEMTNLAFGFGQKKDGLESTEWVKITMLDSSYTGGDIFVRVGR